MQGRGAEGGALLERFLQWTNNAAQPNESFFSFVVAPLSSHVGKSFRSGTVMEPFRPPGEGTQRVERLKLASLAGFLSYLMLSLSRACTAAALETQCRTRRNTEKTTDTDPDTQFGSFVFTVTRQVGTLMASRTSSSACPTMAGPHVPTKSVYLLLQM